MSLVILVTVLKVTLPFQASLVRSPCCALTTRCPCVRGHHDGFWGEAVAEMYWPWMWLQRWDITLAFVNEFTVGRKDKSVTCWGRRQFRPQNCFRLLTREQKGLFLAVGIDGVLIAHPELNVLYASVNSTAKGLKSMVMWISTHSLLQGQQESRFLSLCFLQGASKWRGEEGMTEKRGASLLFVMWPYTSKLYVLAKLEMDVKAVARIKWCSSFLKHSIQD